MTLVAILICWCIGAALATIAIHWLRSRPPPPHWKVLTVTVDGDSFAMIVDVNTESGALAVLHAAGLQGKQREIA